MDSDTKGVVWPKLTLQLGHNKIASWKMLLKIFFFTILKGEYYDLISSYHFFLDSSSVALYDSQSKLILIC